MAISENARLETKGEEVACEYLENKGYIVLERNYWKPWGEIDIVARKGNISFVEVKTVTCDLTNGVSHGTYRPEENVHPAKLKRLHRAIQTYLLQRNVPETVPWQIDVASVFLDLSTKKAKVETFRKRDNLGFHGIVVKQTGRRIPVVRLLWEQDDPVRFWAPRPIWTV
jgi:putative endonuclease